MSSLVATERDRPHGIVNAIPFDCRTLVGLMVSSDHEQHAGGLTVLIRNDPKSSTFFSLSSW